MSRRICRSMLALGLSFLIPGSALAKDLCIQIDTGVYVGSVMVLKKARVTRHSTAPLQGYLAIYGASSYYAFQPLHGGSVVNGQGEMVLGMTLQVAEVHATGTSIGPSSTVINFTCAPGSNGVVDTLDACSGYAAQNACTGHVIPCLPSAAIP